jgi:hypothetical protein
LGIDMQLLCRVGFVCAAFFAAAELTSVWAQGADPRTAVIPPTGPSPSSASDRSGGFRKLVPGVMTTIPADQQEGETTARHDIVEILQGAIASDLSWTPNTLPTTAQLKSMAKDTDFRRNIWCLEFSFKPLRMVSVDVPQPDGTMARKNIWYLVYKVTNRGSHLAPSVQTDGTVKIDRVDHAVVNDKVGFMPLFSLESGDRKTAYLDRLIPLAIPAIQQREDPNRKLLNSVEISSTPIAVTTPTEDNSVWGVATWEDVDPRLNFFSIYVEGLTNAYRWEDPPGKFKPGDPPGTGRKFAYKVLKLNFWRPGDEFIVNEQEVSYGMPDLPGVLEKYKSDAKVDYEWVYR